MKVAFRTMFPDGYPDCFMDIIFNAMDKRRIGYVTFRDFVKTIAITVIGTEDDKLNWAFDVFDQKGDGFVTLDELINVVEALWQLHGESPDMEDHKLHFIRRRTRLIFRRLDVKKEGRISRDQFRDVLKQDQWVIKNVLHVYSSAVGTSSRVVQSP